MSFPGDVSQHIDSPEFRVDAGEQPADFIRVRNVAALDHARRPLAEISSAVRRAPSSLRSTSTRSAPASASASDMARPIPCAAPETTATRPVRSNNEFMEVFDSSSGEKPGMTENCCNTPLRRRKWRAMKFVGHATIAAPSDNRLDADSQQ